MKNTQANQFTRRMRFKTKKDAKAVTQIFLNLKENQFQLENVKSKALK